MTLAKRLDRVAAGSFPNAEVVRQAREQVEASIATIAATVTPEDRMEMGRWWTTCRELCERDPLLATVYAAMTPEDLAL